MASEELMDTEMTNASTKPMKGRGAQSTDNKTLIEGEYETIEGDQAEGEAVKCERSTVSHFPLVVHASDLFSLFLFHPHSD